MGFSDFLNSRRSAAKALVAQLNSYTTKAMAEGIKAACYRINDTFSPATAVKAFYFTFDELAPPTAVKVSRAQLLKKIEEGQVTLIPFNRFRQEEADGDGQSPACATDHCPGTWCGGIADHRAIPYLLRSGCDQYPVFHHFV